MKMQRITFFFTLLFALTLCCVYAINAFATNPDGPIDIAQKYAWSENLGWVNFNPEMGTVVVTDTRLLGYAWIANYSWINLQPTGAGVQNDGTGILSGYAWGEDAGYINFSGVTIDTGGFFHGYALGSITGRISMNCANTNVCGSSDFKVRTTWRRTQITPAPTDTRSGGGGFIPPIPSTVSTQTTPPIATSNEKQKEAQDQKSIQTLQEALCSNFTKVLKKGSVDNRVISIQQFLMQYNFMKTAKTSKVFGSSTETAVKKFQSAYTDSILKPWGLKKPTGIWSITTRKKANEIIGCVSTGSAAILPTKEGALVKGYSLPNATSVVVTTFSTNKEVSYYDHKNNWFYVEYETGKNAWVQSTFIKVIKKSALDQQ